MPSPPRRPAVTLTFDILNLIRSLIAANEYSLHHHRDCSSRSWDIVVTRRYVRTNAADVSPKTECFFRHTVGRQRHRNTTKKLTTTVEIVSGSRKYEKQTRETVVYRQWLWTWCGRRLVTAVMSRIQQLLRPPLQSCKQHWSRCSGVVRMKGR